MKSHIKILLALLVSLGFSSCTFIPAGGAYGGGYQQPPRPMYSAPVRQASPNYYRQAPIQPGYSAGNYGYMPQQYPNNGGGNYYGNQGGGYRVPVNNYGNNFGSTSVNAVPPGQNSVGYDTGWKQRWAR